MQMTPILVAIGNEPTRANIMIATPIRSANMALTLFIRNSQRLELIHTKSASMVMPSSRP